MEITNEIKAKVFAQYLGQYVKCDSEYHGKKELNERSLFGLPPCKLILKPLSSITDEELIIIANMIFIEDMNPKNEEEKKTIPDIARTFISRPEQGIDHRVYQFLQSKGYDLPNYLLGGKTLKEAGLAIYE